MSDVVPSTDPPGHRYRLLTGPDDATFCTRVSEALEEGYELHGSPSVTFNGERVIAAQAVLWAGPAAPTITAATPISAAAGAAATPAGAATTTQNGDDR